MNSDQFRTRYVCAHPIADAKTHAHLSCVSHSGSESRKLGLYIRTIRGVEKVPGSITIQNLLAGTGEVWTFVIGSGGVIGREMVRERSAVASGCQRGNVLDC